MAVDGTTFRMPDTPANKRTFGEFKNQFEATAYPFVQVVALCELGTHALTAWIARRFPSCEKNLAHRLLRHLPAKSLLLGDRNFHSYALWEQAQKRGFGLILRVAKGPKFAPSKVLSDGSFSSVVRPRTLKINKGKPAIAVRVIACEVRDGDGWVTVRFLANLLGVEADGTGLDLAELYAGRWEQELAFKEIKGKLAGRGTELRSHSPELVLQELDGLLLGHYVVRATMLEAARRAKVSPIEISFHKAVRVMQTRLSTRPRSRPAAVRWWDELIGEIARLPRRRRRLRSCPRVRKSTRCPWPAKKPHHRGTKLKPLDERIKTTSLS